MSECARCGFPKDDHKVKEFRKTVCRKFCKEWDGDSASFSQSAELWALGLNRELREDGVNSELRRWGRENLGLE